VHVTVTVTVTAHRGEQDHARQRTWREPEPTGDDDEPTEVGRHCGILRRGHCAAALRVALVAPSSVKRAAVVAPAYCVAVSPRRERFVVCTPHAAASPPRRADERKRAGADRTFRDVRASPTLSDAIISCPAAIRRARWLALAESSEF
jgi:hypothetical protein